MNRITAAGLKACATVTTVTALVAGLIVSPLAGQSRGDHWIGTWTTATIGRPPYPAATAAMPTTTATAPTTTAPTPVAPPTQSRVVFPNNQTLREIVHTTLGGEHVRVVVTNAFGTSPLTIGAAHVALRDRQSAIVTTSDRTLTFGGNATATIPAGAMMTSDAVSINIPDFADLAIDLFVPGDTAGQTLTIHRGALQTSYLSASGNHAGEAAFADATTVTSFFFLERVEVASGDRTAAIVTVGDSITDGTGSTLDANARWPDVLGRRLASVKGGMRTAVLNAGIGGNRMLSEGLPEAGINALARFDRDALLQTGVTHVIVMEGINDIGTARDNPSPSALDIVAAHKQLIDRAHTHGLKIYGATLTPFEGALYYTAAGEEKRMAVNDWIRHGRAYDGVIDFDLATRDPDQPKRFRPEYDRGDHLHPSDAGYQAMANAIPLALFGR
jgi:lysophospholipase L1-like esterase